ncbi:MAG: helix-turn-helix transcriptional regulator [Oscillospiraceae bacterium]|nr:helix-turn-helix transcriptional regulator [Oscillospiraceae bacterium]
MQVSLKAMRINSNMKQNDVAERVGVTVKTLQNWENYVSSPDAIQFAKLCSIFQCSRDDIFLPDNLAKSEITK